MSLALPFHVLAAVVWVGGMFFVQLVLEPSSRTLEIATRLSLWHRVFARYFAWVWLSIVAVLASGFAMILLLFGRPSSAGVYVRIMMMLGVLMSITYAWTYFVLWRRFRRAVAKEHWDAGEQSLRQLRRLVAVTLVLGLATIVVAAAKPYTL
jgi:uncharacterized membrane protein